MLQIINLEKKTEEKIQQLQEDIPAKRGLMEFIKSPKMKPWFTLFRIVIAVIIFIVIAVGIRAMSRRYASEYTLPTPSITETATPASGSIPVFPGAEGFGTLTPAGRGGMIIEVTTLADSGEGSLREALETEGPRTIIFKVGGVINVTSDNLFIRHPFVTVAGQTAPGDGITIIGKGVTIITHDVLIQHLRVRPGDKGGASPDTNDAIEIFDPEWVDARSVDEINRLSKDKVYNIVLDHISASWSEDEAVSVYKGSRDVTISWAIISEALNKAGHSKKTHSAGLMLAGLTDRISVHHSLLAHNDFRNPLIKNSGIVDFRNNIIYDWGIESTFILKEKNIFLGQNTNVNLVSNNYIPGPSTSKEAKPIVIGQDEIEENILYKKDNTLPKTREKDDNIAAFFSFRIDMDLIQGDTIEGKIEWAKKTFFSSEPFYTPRVTTFNAEESYSRVLTGVGANKPKQDYVDKRIINEVRTETGRLIDSVDDVGGYPRFELTIWPEGYDSDHDGMPDTWEREQGLNPADIADGNQDADQDGYTNIEEFLHELLR